MKKINSVSEGLVRRRTKEFYNGAKCQAGFDTSGAQRDATAPIYNAINYIKNVYAF